MKKSIVGILVFAAVLVLCVCFCACGSQQEEKKTKQFEGISIADLQVDWDGDKHSIEITGTLPEGASVKYTYNDVEADGVTDAGTYTVKAIVSCEGYSTKTLSANLRVKGLVFTGITFADKTVDYSGSECALGIQGTLPEGAKVEYTNNKGTNAGVYNAVAVLSCAGYESLTLKATLTINKIQIDTTALLFENKTVEYDGKAHGIVVSGNVPFGATITYTYNGVAVENNQVISPETYDVVATLGGTNYITATMHATLKITSHAKMLYSASLGNSVYFQNSLDGDKLYSYQNGTLKKVNNDVPNYFAADGDKLYYYSESLFSQTIRQISGSTATTLHNPGRATYLATDGTYLYYAKANLVDTKNENGIYKVKIASSSDASEQSATRICTDKASFIVFANNKLYYCNSSDGDKLYSISTNGTDATAITTQKVLDVTCVNGVLYYTLKEGTTNSALYKYNTATGTSTKICNDNASCIAVVGNNIYYINKDILSSNIFGKGIYRVPTTASNVLVGEKVLEGEGYYSMTSDSTNLYYYKLDDKHFYKYNISNDTETDLMANFVVPETAETVTGAASVAIYKDEVYFTNATEDGCLYKYNPETKQYFKVLADSVSNVFFYKDTMYYSTYIFNNYALWRLDMSDSSAESEKISSKRFEELVFADGCIYAINVVVGTNEIVKMDLDGSNVTHIYGGKGEKNIHSTQLYYDSTVQQFYFSIEPNLGGDYLYTWDVASQQVIKQDSGNDCKANNFVIYNNKMYYFNHNQKQLMCCNMDYTSPTVLLSGNKLDITEIVLIGNKIYFTDTKNGQVGIYEYDAQSDVAIKITDKVGHAFTLLDGKVYFINVSITYTLGYPVPANGDGHLYCWDIATGAVTKVA